MTATSKRRTVEARRGQRPSVPKLAPAPIKDWTNEVLGIIFFAFSLFLLLSFVSAERGVLLSTLPVLAPFRNMMGPAGQRVGLWLSELMGWCALVPVFWAAGLGLYFWRTQEHKLAREWRGKLATLPGLLALLLCSCILAAIHWSRTGGGEIGVLFARPLTYLFSSVGASIIAGSCLLVSLALATQSRVSSVLFVGGSFLGSAGLMLARDLPSAILTFLKRLASGTALLLRPILIDFPVRVAKQSSSFMAACLRRVKRPTGRDALLPVVLPPESRTVPVKPRARERKAAKEVEEEELSEDEEIEIQPQRDYSEIIVKRRNLPADRDDAPARGKKKKVAHPPLQHSEYTVPDVALLTAGEVSAGSEDDSELREKSKQIEAKLRDFNIMGKVTEVHPGPVITLFEFEPAPGVKVGRIAALQDDLAMSLRASSIRIIAPIPRKGTVGIEVPNKNRDIVRLRDLLESENFRTAESCLTIPIGKDTYGEPVVADISSMPHLLMAGATGTGKSVCINAILLSLLYKASPADLGLILIDPKVLELSVYEGIPHLRVPVVTVPKQAKAVLEWAVREMDRRYRLMQKYGVRNIDSYNKIVNGEPEGSPAPAPSSVIILSEQEIIAEGTVEPLSEEETPQNVDNTIPTEQLEKLPKIVIVIDELADLMLTVGREIEELITRLAQKARASGIHLIVATQRPSVDVITGLIKANFPARLSFRVTSRIDSRTILDSMGAEKLLGKGDMLFMLPGAVPLKRIHGAFVSDSEVKRVVSAIKEKSGPNYDQNIMAVCDKAVQEEGHSEGDGEGEEGEYDSFYDKAVELVVEKRQASTSMIQRAFRIGYNRAARIIEMMEREGIVGPMDGVKPREVLVPPAE